MTDIPQVGCPSAQIAAVLCSEQASWVRGAVVRASDARTEQFSDLGSEVDRDIGLIAPPWIDRSNRFFSGFVGDVMMREPAVRAVGG